MIGQDNKIKTQKSSEFRMQLCWLLAHHKLPAVIHLTSCQSADQLSISWPAVNQLTSCQSAEQLSISWTAVNQLTSCQSAEQLSFSWPAVKQLNSCHSADQLSFSWPAVIQLTSCQSADQLSISWPAVIQLISCQSADQLSISWPAVIQLTRIIYTRILWLTSYQLISWRILFLFYLSATHVSPASRGVPRRGRTCPPGHSAPRISRQIPSCSLQSISHSWNVRQRDRIADNFLVWNLTFLRLVFLELFHVVPANSWFVLRFQPTAKHLKFRTLLYCKLCDVKWNRKLAIIMWIFFRIYWSNSRYIKNFCKKIVFDNLNFDLICISYSTIFLDSVR